MNQTELLAELRQGITGGRFPVGGLLPTEFELCERYDASRYAVRMALSELQEQGLISRRKNVGTRVEANRPVGGFVQALASAEDLAQFGAEHVRVVRRVEEVVVDLALAKELQCAGGSRWLRISSLRLEGAAASTSNDVPVGWTDVYVDARYTLVGKLARKSPGTLISTLIEERYGRSIARIQQDVEAAPVPVALAAELQVEPGSAALKIVRRYLDSDDEAFEISVTMHPAGRFKMSMDMTRAKT